MADSVQTYNDAARVLIEEAIQYAQAGVYNEQAANNIRQVQVITQVLQAALLQGGAIPRPPPGSPEAMAMEAAVATRAKK
jgi:hypothetical protein